MTNDNNFQEQVVERLSSLDLNVKDEILVNIIDERIKAASGYWEKKKLRQRQKKNWSYLMGKQVDPKDLHPSSIPYMENVIWEAYKRNRAIMMSRVPDIEAKSGDFSEEGRLAAEKISKITTSDIKNEENSRVISEAVMHRQAKFYGVVKCRWSQIKDDYEFVVVPPENIILDHTVKRKEDARFISELVTKSVKKLLIMFPDKEKELLDEIAVQMKVENVDKLRNSEKFLATTITYTETWFEDYLETKNENGESVWQTVVAVVCKYGNVILQKIKHPYWDWDGDPNYFMKSMPKPNSEMTLDDIFMNLEEETVFRNYLPNPEFPYYVITLNDVGEDQIDISNNMEQILYFQDNINIEGRQITDMNSRSRGKEVFSSDGLSKDAVESIDVRDPDQMIVTDGDVRSVHKHIDFPAATPQLYKSKSENRSIAFEMMDLNATTRGVRESGDETLGARQMMREQDFGVLDYEVARTINPLAIWMGRWVLHMIKVFYTKGKMRRLVGKDGEIVKEMINSDMIDDGMQILVSASSVDKNKKIKQAISDAANGMSDPLSYFEDTDQSNPKERALRVMLLKMAPELYIQKYLQVTGDNTANQLMATLRQKMMQQQQAQMAGAKPQEQPAMGGGGWANDGDGLMGDAKKNGLV